MRRIDDTTVELTEAEALVTEIHGNLLDAGMTSARAVDLISGAHVPPMLRGEMPLLDEVMSPGFTAWLRGES